MTENMQSAFICDAIRTPFGRYGGVLASVRPDDLAVYPMKALLTRNPGLDPAAIDDVILGNVNQAGEDNRNVARMSLLLAGIPQEVPGATVNRLCASGMEAVAAAARAIGSGEGSLFMAGGVESMTRSPFVLAKADGPWARPQKFEDSTLGWRFVNPRMRELYGVDSMAETAENVALEWNVSRADQDAFALRSQQRCAAATAQGLFAVELIPVPIARKDPVTQDEHPRPDTTAEGLAKLKPVTRPDGTVTAGNASGINDGAAALIVASEAAASRHGLRLRARILGTAVAGVAPRVMGIGPVPAVKKLLARLGMSLGQMDVIELNEAFAAQSVGVLRGLGLPDDAAHVNPNGGAIALGHPLGASGARLVTAALCQLERTGGRYALCTMCIGVGQGIAMAIERV
jgi:3-oxoadipyl-CoA thiolase